MRIILALLFVCFLQGCAGSMDEQIDEDLGLDFTNVCLGRYQMDLIDTLKMSSLMYGNRSVSFYLDSNLTESLTFDGRERFDKWSKSIQKESRRKYRAYPLSDDVRVIESETFFENKYGDEGEKFLLKGFLLKDFSSLNRAVYARLALSGTEGNFLASDSEYRNKFKKLLHPAKDDLDRLLHLPWPHNQLGVCLTSDFTLNVAKAGGEKHYRTVWWNGKNDRFEINVNVMKNKEELSENYGTAQKLLGLFASKSLDLAGRSGRLFLSDARYAKDGLEFRWVTTDAKIGSTARPYIELEGTVDMANYPKFKQVGMDARDIIVIMLKTFRVRENGLIGTS
ncbi:hypothetical protein [Pelagibaculum spongiae]|nr:hypothetical protein [Pelagibaculum spongiae]